MKERGILFSAPMVRALLDGSKTQTRRAVKGLPDACKSISQHHEIAGAFFLRDEDGRVINKLIICPYGQPGDRLWVRETWSTHACFDAVRPSDLTTRSVHYWSDGEVQTGKRRPSMFMPRWASRITLEITGVRVERLQDISEADAMAEGIDLERLAESQDKFDMVADENMTGRATAASYYRSLWGSINGAGSCDANPWVWAVEFRRID